MALITDPSSVTKIIEFTSHLKAGNEATQIKIESVLPLLRGLRTEFSQLSTNSDNICCQRISDALSHLVISLMSTEFRLILETTDGRDHLLLSISLQCLVNYLSSLFTGEFRVSKTSLESIWALFYLINENSIELTQWVFGLVLDSAQFPLWRLRVAAYSFILVTHLVRLDPHRVSSGALLLLASQCIGRVICLLEIDMKLCQDWFDHCLSLIVNFTISAPVYVDLRQFMDFLGNLLICGSSSRCQEALVSLEAPSISKLASSFLNACLTSAHTLGPDFMLETVYLLTTCLACSPFQFSKETQSEEIPGVHCELKLRDNVGTGIATLRGCVFALNALAADADQRTGDVFQEPLKQKIFSGNEEVLKQVVSCLGDCLIVIDALLHNSLGPEPSFGERKKMPSLMDKMGDPDFSKAETICFAHGLKQEILRCLVAAVYAFPGLISDFHQPPATNLRCMNVVDPSSSAAGDGGGNLEFIAIPFHSRDVFTAILNSTERDPASPLAVEWAILLLRLLINPFESGLKIQKRDEGQLREISFILSSRLRELEELSLPRSDILRQLYIKPKLTFSASD